LCRGQGGCGRARGAVLDWSAGTARFLTRDPLTPPFSIL
jgi:hypothetical protein